MASDAAALAVREVYTRLAAEVEARRPICTASGRCCHFDAYGHRLYVTTLELAAFGREVGDFTQISTAGPAGGCPFQVGRLCGVHAHRPFGCRVFFCDPTAADWQQQQYERFHGELKALHGRLEVPYFYVEWRSALQQLGWGDTGPLPEP